MNESLVTQHTAKRVRQLRLAKEWSQENLALTADLSVAYVGQIERAKRFPASRPSVKFARHWRSHFHIFLRLMKLGTSMVVFSLRPTPSFPL